jgi:hypothetical protein
MKCTNEKLLRTYDSPSKNMEATRMLSDKEKLIRLKDFGIWIDNNTDTICLARNIYTEGGKNEEVHRAIDKYKWEVKLRSSSPKKPGDIRA